MQQQAGAISMVRGFRAAGVACGLKAGGAKDLALVVSDVPCRAAALFTRNVFKAAPVLYDQDLLARNPTGIQTVVINSGCANACTGELGLANARHTAQIAGEVLELPAEAVFVMSTGVIGQQLDMSKVAAGIREAASVLSPAGGANAALAIMTTDTRPKEVLVPVRLDGRTGAVAGVAKGAGMIHPDMATMLVLLVTDVAIGLEPLRAALRAAVERSFHRITVDGDTSTNDTVLLLANGLAGNREIVDITSQDYTHFVGALSEACITLAKMIASDGEGATRLVEIRVEGAASVGEATLVGRTIATSPLVKTALYGRDANWGRVLAAAGRSGAAVQPDKVALWFGDLQLVDDGQPVPLDEERASAILSQPEVVITINLGVGGERATVWTCDLSHDYVSINAHYRT
jgi:glutamate N-acetyltransferase/amino-acid N-acetyltransferase